MRSGAKWAVALAFLAACGSSEPVPGGPCTVSKDCVSGETCVGGACQIKVPVPNCETDDQCLLNERCDTEIGECVFLEALIDAGPMADGAASDGGRRDLGVDTGVRDSGASDSGFVGDLGPRDADPDAAMTDAFDAGTLDSGVIPDAGFPDSGVVTCTLDADCGNPNSICLGNICGPACFAPGAPACPGTDACNPTSGRCVPGNIALGLDCTFDLECASDLCLPLTIGMASRSLCTSACGASGQCPIDFSCTYVSGMSFCLGEDLTTPPGTYDTAAGGACSTTVNTCQSTWCNTGSNVCMETCSRASDCGAFGGLCWSYIQPGTPTTYDHLCFNGGGPGAAGTSCTLDSNCQSGICDRYRATCAAHCCADSDCPAPQSCAGYDLDATNVVKICVLRSPTAGNGALGAACTTFADCESEVCVLVDPNNAAGPRKCSTFCCRDADCLSLPAGGRCMPTVGPVMNTIIGACRPN